MHKTVELSATVFRWLQSIPSISEELIIGIVLHTPREERHYTNDDHFEIEFSTNNKRHTFKITL